MSTINLEICSKYRSRTLYPNQFNMGVEIQKQRNYNNMNNEVILDSIPIHSFKGLGEIKGSFVGGTTKEPILFNNENEKQNYDYTGCTLKSSNESSLITNYNNNTGKCILSSPLSQITGNFSIQSPNTNELYIPFGSKINNKYYNHYLENTSIEDNIENRYTKIISYNSVTQIVTLEDEKKWNNTTSRFRIRKEKPFIQNKNKINDNQIILGCTKLKLTNNGTHTYKVNEEIVLTPYGIKIKILSIKDNKNIANFEIINPGNIQEEETNDIVKHNLPNGAQFKIVTKENILPVNKDNLLGSMSDINKNCILYNNIIEKENNNLPVRFNTVSSVFLDTEKTGCYRIKKIFTDKDKYFILLNNSNSIVEIKEWELHFISMKNHIYHLNYYKNIKHNICYNIKLLKLILPNVKLQNGGYITDYSHVYVSLESNEISNTNKIISNNPHSKNAIFRVSIVDSYKSNHINKFICLRSDMKQIIQFNFNSDIRIKVFLENGEEIATLQKDTLPPWKPDPLLQMNVLFELIPVS